MRVSFLALACLLVVSLASGVSPVVSLPPTPNTNATTIAEWSSCAATTADNFVTTSASTAPATAMPGTVLYVSIEGSLNLNVTAGMYNLRVTSSHAIQVDEQFGTLESLLKTPLPSAGPQATIGFNWAVPAAGVFDNREKELTLELTIYSQTFTELTCVSVTVPITMPPASRSTLLGYACALVSVLTFGTNFLPAKSFDTGDGVFFQWMLAIGVWLCGLAIQLIRGSPPFEPVAMLGGVMWAVGNAMSVPIIQMIGLGVGMSIWGTATLISGWASGRYGFFGINKQAVDNETMNVVGLIVCVASMGIMFQVKSVKEEQQALKESSASLLSDDRVGLNSPNLLESGDVPMNRRGDNVMASPRDSFSDDVAPSAGNETWVDRLSPSTKRTLGISMSLVAGCLYGMAFDPPQWLIDTGRGQSSHGIDYVFSHFTGILVTATLYFVLYAMYSRNAPLVSGQLVLPGMLSGAVWGVGEIAWFIANGEIGFVGTFPLISCGPGMVATLCAIVFFKEIQGARNYAFLGLTACVIIVGVVLIALSLPPDN